MQQSDDNMDDDVRPSNTLDHFTELEQVLEMIQNIKGCDVSGFERDYERFTEILSRYQEQPHLLDPHLDELLSALLIKIHSIEVAENILHACFKYMYVLCKVRTYKTLIKFLPHELSDLEFVLNLLEKQDSNEHSNWETRYMLILWMSLLVMNPFHMARLDAYRINSVNHSEDYQVLTNHSQSKSKMERIYDLCKLYTSTNDTCSDVAAYLSAKYFIRSDIKDLYLERFLNCIIDYHNADTFNIKFGQLAAVSAILKHGKREDLLPYADKLLRWIIACQYKDSKNFKKYKIYIKIIQRIGLVYLKPRIAEWRYKRGTRSLIANLNQHNMTESTTAQANANINSNKEMEEEENDDIFVPDSIEEVIEELLQALRSGSGDVRWSAAKGIGRVTNRLPKDYAEEVVQSVIHVLDPLEPHEAWHGACLASAELAKRGLLLPHNLNQLVPLLVQALFYDEMKGYMSVGQHIRDAACYMCWAFARAYNPDDLQPFVHKISAGLLTAAVFDREINCRRAASAAFQESVGRLGNFPHGIEISTTTDFFSVGNRQNSFLKISDFIANFVEYARPLINHLVDRKVNHWDISIRELSAKALHKLTYRDPEYMASFVLSKLFGKTNSIDINSRHGSVLAIGEIIMALKDLEDTSASKVQYISPQILNDLNELINRFLVRDLFRGMSGEIMKQCCTDFIRNCSLAKIKVTADCLDSWQSIIDTCILNKTATIREGAVSAFAQLCSAFYNCPDRLEKNASIIKDYLKGAENDLEENIRMGYLSALGVIPKFLAIPYFEEILQCLCSHSLTPLQAVISGGMQTNESQTNSQVHTWSEARREAVKSLRNMVLTIGFDTNEEVSFGQSKYLNKVLECLLKAMEEYTLDNRGDIGAWVREAAMNAIYTILTECPKQLLQPSHVHSIILHFLQQAVEKIDRTRGLAGRLLCNLIHAQPEIPHIKHHETLKATFPSDSSKVLWLFADHTFPMFCSLLHLPDYSKRILLGLSASIGQLTESLIKHSSTALFQFLRTNPSEIPRLCKEIIENFEENVLNERVTYPLLSFLDILMSSGTISIVLNDEENPFAEDVFRLVNMEIKGYKKLYKLTSSTGVYCQLLQVPHLRKRVLSKLAIFLGLQHVHVRKTTSTKLYEALALYGDDFGYSEETLDEILTLVSETDWGLPLVQVRPVRNQLCTLLGIKTPVGNVAQNKTNS